MTTQQNTPAETIQQEGTPKKIKLTGIRKAIAANMYGSLRSMAQTSDAVELDVTELVALRKELVERQEEIGCKITINDLLSYAATQVMKECGYANSTFDGETVTEYPYVNISMAVGTDFGLMSPVLANADQMKLPEFSAGLKDLAVRARSKKLTAKEHSGGTFTVTNMGIHPVDMFNPIINPPQTTIIGFGRCVEKPAVYKGEIAVRTMMYLSVTYDHRVFDGSGVGRIMKEMQERLEHPDWFRQHI